jgi:glutamate/tyrosine decarboxylase-like PLP-dependent enzyme
VNVDEFRRHGHAVVDLLADHLDELPRRPPWTPVPPDRRQVLAGQELPAAGHPFDELLQFMAVEVLPYPFGNGHPRFFAWGNPPPALEGVLADFVAAAMNPSCAGGDHAAIYLERCTTRWVAELVGYPGDGVLVSGGADGALTALAAARHRAAARDGWDDLTHGVTSDRASRYRLYASTETHSCQRKAARLLGLGDAGVHLVPVDRTGRLDVEALVTAIRDDRAAGLHPFCVVANAGAVSTGAVDPLAAIADLCETERLWFHVDGSLGGFGVLDRRRRPLFRGLERADSLVLDPHKWLSVPVDCAVVLVRDLDGLRDAFSLVPPYLRSATGELPWYSEYVYDQTRPFRALKLWATLAGVGRDGIVARITRNVDHASRLADQIESSDDLELVAEPTLNVVAFRHAGGDEVNRAIPGVVQSAGDVFLRGTVVHGAEALRACFMHHATTTDDVDRIVPAVLRAAHELASA